MPLVEALHDRGLPIGTLLAFMMAVVALSLPEMILLRRVLKPRLLASYFLDRGISPSWWRASLVACSNLVQLVQPGPRIVMIMWGPFGGSSSQQDVEQIAHGDDRASDHRHG